MLLVKVSWKEANPTAKHKFFFKWIFDRYCFGSHPFLIWTYHFLLLCSAVVYLLEKNSEVIIDRKANSKFEINQAKRNCKFSLLLIGSTRVCYSWNFKCCSSLYSRKKKPNKMFFMSGTNSVQFKAQVYKMADKISYIFKSIGC